MFNIGQLKAIQKNLQEQDNRSTADPLFCVMERDSFVSAHFTEKAAQEYISINGHNLNKPYIHVISLFQCEEMKAVRNMLLNGDIMRLAEENEWLTSKLLRAGCVVQHDGSFFLEDVPEMIAREFDLLKQENKRLRQVCADAARKISNDVRDLGPCGRQTLTDVYIMLNEAANGGGE
jgi:hypothetical protein